MLKNIICPVCNSNSNLLDVVDLNKSCEELRGKFFSLSGIPVYYALCDGCGFCFSPELHDWGFDKFEKYIYNADYVSVDPDYLEVRPKGNSSMLKSLFSLGYDEIRHLDYGGGNGVLANLMRDANWNSSSYDPFVDRSTKLENLGKFNLITAFEVFEHVPDVRKLMSDLDFLLSENGLILFSTLISDGNIFPNKRLDWWYASPRNGHISLFSRRSLALLAKDTGFHFGSFSENYHVLFKTVPSWASHFIKIG